MARPKKEDTANQAVVRDDTITSEIADEVFDDAAELKAKLAEQERQMSEMMAKMQAMMAGANMVAQAEPVSKASRNIKFINLTAGGLNLKGNRFYHMDAQFDSKMIPESEARAIVNNMPNTMVNGMVYIADADFVREMELDGAYTDLLSDEQMKALLTKSAGEVCEIYRNVSDTQKQIIVDMVSDRKMSGLPVDANILVELGKLCGKDLMAIESEDE